MKLITRRSLLGTVALGGLASRLPAAKLSAFKLGITTDEVDDDLAVAIEFIKRFGLKYAEIRGLWGKYNTSQPLDNIRRAKKLLDENNIDVCILDTGFFKVPLPPETAEGSKARVTAKGVRALRKKLKLSQGQFGELVGVSGNTVLKWEHGSGPLKLRSRPRRALLSIRGLGIREARLRLGV